MRFIIDNRTDIGHDVILESVAMLLRYDKIPGEKTSIYSGRLQFTRPDSSSSDKELDYLIRQNKGSLSIQVHNG